MARMNVENICPRCGKEFNGVECEHCGYGSESDKIAYGYDEDDLERIPFPSNNATLACYVVAIILVVSAVLLYSFTSLTFTLLMVGIACVVAGIGKGVQVLYRALQSIHDDISRVNHNGK